MQPSKDIQRQCQECNRPNLQFCYLLSRKTKDKYGEVIEKIAVCYACILKNHGELIK